MIMRHKSALEFSSEINGFPLGMIREEYNHEAPCSLAERDSSTSPGSPICPRLQGNPTKEDAPPSRP